MAHFAELDENNIVLRVVRVENAEIIDENGNENEQKGIDFCKTLFGSETRWLQTSYNKSFRKNYAGIGFKYDETLDAFLELKLYPSWILNKETWRWEPPTPLPGGDPVPEVGKIYEWNEEKLAWELNDILTQR